MSQNQFAEKHNLDIEKKVSTTACLDPTSSKSVYQNFKRAKTNGLLCTQRRKARSRSWTLPTSRGQGRVHSEDAPSPRTPSLCPPFPLPSACAPSSPQLMLRTYWTEGWRHVWVPGRAYSPAGSHSAPASFQIGGLPPRQLAPRSDGSPLLKCFHIKLI